MSQESPATPRQLAYLRYLGKRNTRQLTKHQATAEIDRLHLRAEHPCFGRLKARTQEWSFARLEICPELYEEEVNEFILFTFGDILRSFVRNRIVGASERLTEDRLVQTISSLTTEDPRWWKAPAAAERFFERLAVLFPGCADGHPPAKRPKVSLKQSKPPTGCLSVLVGALMVGLVILRVAAGW